jgi:hypothetical protein
MKKTAQILTGAFVLGLIACSESNKTAGGVSIEENTVAEGVSSSSVEQVSSSSVQQGISSATVSDVSMSSGTIAVTPVPVEVDVKPVILWDGDAGVYKVNTESEDSGYWFTWNDNDEGGLSKISFPVEMGNEYSEDQYDAVIDYCSGFCGTVYFDGPIPNPSAGAAFSVADEGQYADISEWRGLCVTYSSELLFDVYVVPELGDDADASAVPRVEMPRATDTTLCVSWQAFAAEEAVKKARIVGFEFKGAAGETGFFNIKAITSYDESLPQLSGSN